MKLTRLYQIKDSLIYIILLNDKRSWII